MEQRSVVVTGIGVVAPNGSSKKEFWDSLVSGSSGIRVLDTLDPDAFPNRLGGKVDRIPVPTGMEKGRFERLGRYVQLGLAAGVQAVEDSGLSITDENRGRIGISVGTALGGTAVIEEQRDAVRTSRRRRVNPVVSFGGLAPSAVPGEIARHLKIHGPLNVVTTGCAASSSAIVQAYDELKRGYLDAMVVGGTEAPLTEVVFSTYTEAKNIASRSDEPQRASRPFDRDRDGIVLAEGAAMFVLEDEELARERGAHIYARVLGRGITCDASGAFNSDETGDYAAIAMKQAVDEARIPEMDLRYIAACATSDRSFDKKESAAIRKAFGNRAFDMAVSSIKSLTGHPLGACGALQTVAGVLAMETGVIPPTWNYFNQDPDCDLDYVPNTPRSKDLEYTLVNASGLGGVNVAMVLGRA